MGRKQLTRIVLAGVALVVLAFGTAAVADTFGTGANQFTLDFVPISGATNPTDTSPSRYYGTVDRDYRISKFEITNDQWNKFVANLSPVTVTGNPSNAYVRSFYNWGTGTLSVPTNAISWLEAAQFANWLNTSTGHQEAYTFTGTQGTSDYTFATWSPTEAAGGTNLYRNKNAFYFLPTEDEWVKAAYWNGTALQMYANASAGDLISGEPDPAKWNYFPSAGYAPWDVGSGGQELNGTFDMMGNVWEWLESPQMKGDYGTGSSRGVRGGSFYLNSSSILAVSSRDGVNPTYEYDDVGFRVASVPEPCSITLLVAALAGLLCWKLRR